MELMHRNAYTLQVRFGFAIGLILQKKDCSANPASAFCKRLYLRFQALAGKTRSFLAKTTGLLYKAQNLKDACTGGCLF